MTPKELARLADLAESIANSAEMVGEAWADYQMPDGDTARDRREAADQAASEMESHGRELASEARQIAELLGDG